MYSTLKETNQQKKFYSDFNHRGSYNSSFSKVDRPHLEITLTNPRNIVGKLPGEKYVDLTILKTIHR